MKKEQDQFKDLLIAELQREAEEILAELEADKSRKPVKCPENSRELLLQRIRAYEEEKAAYEKLSEKDKEALRLGREMQLQIENAVEEPTATESKKDSCKILKFTKKKKKVFLLVGLVGVLVVAMGAPVIGEVPLVKEITNNLLGEKELTQVDSERENVEKIIPVGEAEEGEIYRKIKETFDADIMKLEYLPEGVVISEYDIDKALNRATIMYKNDENMTIEYNMQFNYREQVYGYIMEDEVVSEKVIEQEGMLVTLRKYRIAEKNQFSYLCTFECQDVGYILRVETDKNEEEILCIVTKMKKF